MSEGLKNSGKTMGWREEQKIALRQRLYDVAIELFRNQGFEKTTMQQIADSAGVAKGTFFNHFRSKDHILFEWYQRVTTDALSRAKSAEFASITDALGTFAEDLTGAVERDKQLWRAKTQSTFTGELLQEGERNLDEELLAFCGDLVAQAKQRNEIKPDLNNRFFAELFVAVLTGTGHSWVVSGQKFDLKRVTQQRVEFIIRAALT